MATSGKSPIFCRQIPSFSSPCRRPRHFLQQGGENRAERDVIRFRSHSRGQFPFVMAGYPQPHPGPTDRGEIGAAKVFLAEMDEVASQIQRDRQ